MTNMWDYSIGQRVRITDVDGGMAEGIIICIDDIEECTDMDLIQEDCFTIETKDGRCIGFYQGEISGIEVI